VHVALRTLLAILFLKTYSAVRLNGADGVFFRLLFASDNSDATGLSGDPDDGWLILTNQRFLIRDMLGTVSNYCVIQKCLQAAHH
jgi:hypothetical protein